MSDPSDDKRRFSRILFDSEAAIISGERHWPSRLIDISLKGALVERPSDWQAREGDEFTLELVLDNGTTIIRMDVVVVAHIHPHSIGFSCRYIDLDSVTHLKRLVEFNLGDPELMERELSALGGD